MPPAAGTFSGLVQLVSAATPMKVPSIWSLLGGVTSPEITVRLDVRTSPDGQTVDFGITAVNSPISHGRSTVINDGTATLSLAPLDPGQLCPPGFTLVSDVGLTALAPGQTTSFTIRLKAIDAAPVRRRRATDSNDADENPFDLVLRGAS